MYELSIERYHSAVAYSGKISHIAVPGGQVIEAKLAKIRVSAGTGQNFHQVNCGFEIVLQLLGGFFDNETSAQMWPLGGNANGAVIELPSFCDIASASINPSILICPSANIMTLEQSDRKISCLSWFNRLRSLSDLLPYTFNEKKG